MNILKALNNEITKFVFGENDRVYNIVVIMEEESENDEEYFYVTVDFDKDHKDPSFLLFSNLKELDLLYEFTNEEMEVFTTMVENYEENLNI